MAAAEQGERIDEAVGPLRVTLLKLVRKNTGDFARLLYKPRVLLARLGCIPMSTRNSLGRFNAVNRCAHQNREGATGYTSNIQSGQLEKQEFVRVIEFRLGHGCLSLAAYDARSQFPAFLYIRNGEGNR